LCNTYERHISGKQVNIAYMPKSAMTISDNGSFVQKRMFSSLSTGHLSDPNISEGDEKRGRATYLRF